MLLVLLSYHILSTWLFSLLNLFPCNSKHLFPCSCHLYFSVLAHLFSMHLVRPSSKILIAHNQTVCSWDCNSCSISNARFIPSDKTTKITEFSYHKVLDWNKQIKQLSSKKCTFSCDYLRPKTFLLLSEGFQKTLTFPEHWGGLITFSKDVLLFTFPLWIFFLNLWSPSC